jgi:uncharacterized protein (TIGR02117 family)
MTRQTFRWIGGAAAGVALLGMAGCCTTPRPGLFPPSEGSLTRVVFVVEHGWHAGIVVAWRDVPPGILPPLPTLPAREWLEIGWGDHDFYRTPDAGVGLALKAALVPTASVLHITSFSGRVEQYFPGSGITRLELTPAGLEALLHHVAASFARDGDGSARDLGRGLYGESRFFASRERYHLFKTCNVWTARALHSAGIPIRAASTFTTSALMERLRPHGELVQIPSSSPG